MLSISSSSGGSSSSSSSSSSGGSSSGSSGGGSSSPFYNPVLSPSNKYGQIYLILLEIVLCPNLHVPFLH